MDSQKSKNNRPDMVDNFFINLVKPYNLALFLRWAWIISLFMLIFGYILIYLHITDRIMIR